ncbi:MAG: DUF5678 domain-containing protein [Anaerolineae bacterium]
MTIESRISWCDPAALGLTPEEILLDEEDEKWLNTWGADEHEKYSGKYVAVREKQVVASAESLEDVYKELDAQGIRHALIAYIPSGWVVYKNAI